MGIRGLVGLAMVAGCTGKGPSDTDSPTHPHTDVHTGDTAPVHTGDTGPEEPTVDCSVLPPVPAQFTTMTGFTFSEDFDFDFDGYHVSINANGALRGVNLAGDTRLIAPNVAVGAACTRMLPDGNFVVCNVNANSLVHVNNATGEKTTVLSGLSYPNGGEVDPEGFVYVAEQNAGRVRRIDPATGEASTVAVGLNNPNGVIFDPTYTILYVGSFGGGMVYAIDRTGPDTWEPPRILAQHPGPNGGFDGINVDECGNVYITEFIAGKVFRITPDGQTVDLLASLPSSWIPNMRWGTGRDGWDEHTLYVSDRDQGRLFAIEMGLRGKPSFAPPVPPVP